MMAGMFEYFGPVLLATDPFTVDQDVSGTHMMFWVNFPAGTLDSPDSCVFGTVSAIYRSAEPVTLPITDATCRTDGSIYFEFRVRHPDPGDRLTFQMVEGAKP